MAAISMNGIKKVFSSPRDVIDSCQVDAPLSKTLSIVASIRLPYRCDRINKIYPQMPLHLGVKFHRVLRLSAVSTRENSWAIARSNKPTAVSLDGNALSCTTALSRKYNAKSWAVDRFSHQNKRPPFYLTAHIEFAVRSDQQCLKCSLNVLLNMCAVFEIRTFQTFVSQMSECNECPYRHTLWLWMKLIQITATKWIVLGIKEWIKYKVNW